jgi:hypothetical protein
MGIETDSGVSARHSAISKALEGIPEFGDDFKLPTSEVKEPAAETPVEDVQVAETPAKEATLDAGKTPEKPASGDQQAEKPDAQAAAQFEAPKNWPKERKQAFADLPDAAKKLILETHKDSTVGFNKFAESTAASRKTGEAVTKIFEPYRDELSKAGVDEATAITQLVKEREAFNRDPIGFLAPIAVKAGNGDPTAFIKALIEKTGVTAESLFGSQTRAAATPEDPNIWVDPALTQYKAEISQKLSPLEKQLQSLTQFIETEKQRVEREQGERQRAAQETEQRELETAADELSGVISEQDEQGNLKYPYYDQLEDDIIRLLNTDPQLAAIPASERGKKFDLAYRKAMRLNDDLFQREQDAEFNRRMAEQAKVKTVEKAAIAATRKGAPGSNGAVRSGPMSSRDAINKAFGDLGIV